MKRARTFTGLVVAGLATAAATPLLTHEVSAADHLDAPKTKAFAAADITDVYAWHTDDGKVVVVLNFAGFGEAGVPATYDSTVLYGVHVDSDGDNEADHDVWVRFGQNGAGEWGVQFVGVPGSEAAVVGPVGTVIDGQLGQRMYAGLRDDPFFFDLDGFQATTMTGTLSFDSTNDSFAQTNVTSIVFEMATDAVLDGGTTFTLWASTRAPA